MIDWTIIGSVSIAVIGICGTLLTAKIQHKGRPENALIDQLQEDIESRDQFWKAQIAEVKATANEAKATADRAEEKANKSERRERVLQDYAGKLRRQIERGDPPPPIEWPLELND